ncbi:MAG TPA: 5,6-dimethylbenzimidazole synthase [Candidatus Angelobacter sp.]|jgi:5,6-dimethylbenzimidazole synthase|nr:5,6-dimethylbenzimidazole synthase [Candidatus Angelobacter sp.]
MASPSPDPAGDAHRYAFPDGDRDAVYRAIHQRRDVRLFRSDPVPDTALARLLTAGHRAPSVGFMQPWNFLVIRSAATRQRVRDLYLRERQAAACFFDEPRRSQYLGLKLEGICEAPVNVCVTCDPTRGGTQVLGRNSQPETDVYSTCLAVENIWLAARAEGLGVGWVSILKAGELREILAIPPHVIPVAYLCIGWPVDLPARPMLQDVGWRERLSLDSVVRGERFDIAADLEAGALANAEDELTRWSAPG